MYWLNEFYRFIRKTYVIEIPIFIGKSIYVGMSKPEPEQEIVLKDRGDAGLPVSMKQ